MNNLVKGNIVLSESEYDYARSEYLGYCLNCGEERSSCEPDACEYSCKACGENQVYGAEELLMMGRLEFLDETEEV